MAGVNDTNVSFSHLKAAYVAGGNTDATGNSSLRDGNINTDISLSFFRNAGFTNGTSVPSGSNEISINDIKGKTFGSKIITTDKFKAYDNWSAHSQSLKGTTSTYGGSNRDNKRVRLYNSGQSSSYKYPILLLSPSTDSSDTPGIIVDRTDDDVVDEATVWFSTTNHTYYNQVQFGIVAKDMTTNNWTTQKSSLTNKHATYCDRLCFHGYGFHNYSGSRDDITSSDNVIDPAWTDYDNSLTTYSDVKSGGITTYFHTRTGKSAGTQRSNNAASAPGLGTNAYFFKNSYNNYPHYRGNSIYVNHGLKLKWYETTIQATLENNSNVIIPVSSDWTSSDLTDVFAGMYVYGTGINSNDGAFIGNIHTNYMEMYKQRGSSTTSLVDSLASDDSGTTNLTNVTLTISGYLYWTLVTSPESSSSSTTNYVDAKIMGPPHQVLPKYQASTSTSTPSTEITEWAFFIGDTTSNTSNHFYYDIRDQEPGGTAFSYSVSYTQGTEHNSPGPSPGVYPHTRLYANGHIISFGNKGTSLQTVTYDLSSSNYANSSVIGKTGHLLYSFATVSGSNKYRADIQLVSVTVNGSTHNIGGTGSGLGNYANWRRSTGTNNEYYNSGDYSSLSAVSNFGTNSTHNSTAYSHRWLRKSSGGTTSGSTGVNTSSPYIKFEATAGGSSYPMKAILVSPEVTFTSNSVTIKYYAYGADIANLRGGVEITDSS
tara:strand:- start:2939 stop:5068 length:2130 start_codon:yes stop_codon:yes gene_type:complete